MMLFDGLFVTIEFCTFEDFDFYGSLIKYERVDFTQQNNEALLLIKESTFGQINKRAGNGMEVV
jgi:hypothetical protein